MLKEGVVTFLVLERLRTCGTIHVACEICKLLNGVFVLLRPWFVGLSGIEQNRNKTLGFQDHFMVIARLFIALTAF